MIAWHDLYALGAAACWAFGSMISVTPSRRLGAFAFVRWRMLIVALTMWAVTLGWGPMGGWRGFAPVDWVLMAVSGLIGVFIGDTALFAAMNRLGPRRTGVLFATHAMFSAALGYAVMGDRIGAQALLGALLVVAGVMTAILLGRHREESHAWESDRGHAGFGVALALLAALCQALASLAAKPVLAQPQVDPIAASAVRLSAATLAHFGLLAAGLRSARAQSPLTPGLLLQTGVNGLIAMGVGMTLVLLALREGDVGTVAVLSSVSPVLLLPMLWLHLRRAPAPAAWLGAGLTVVGTALVLLR